MRPNNSQSLVVWMARCPPLPASCFPLPPCPPIVCSGPRSESARRDEVTRRRRHAQGDFGPY